MSDTQDIQKREIPRALSAISYLYFLNGVWILALGGFFMYLNFSTSSFNATDAATIWVASLMVFGFFLIGVSRGLRRCSRGWRTCALILTWIGIFGILFRGYELLAPHLILTSHKPVAELSEKSILFWVCALLFQMWQLRVLTRLDVRDLFYDEP
jgi:hypothetical protein